MSVEPDYYEILEVHPKASAEVIAKAYRTLARRYHPDTRPEREKPWAEKQMKQLNQAYRVLSDPGLRAKYDRRRSPGKAVPAEASVGESGPQATATRQPRYCYWHPTRLRTSICQHCGKLVCRECARTYQSTVVCESCLATNECAAPGSRHHRRRLKALTGVRYDCGDAQFGSC